MSLKLGKTAAREGAVSFRFNDFVKTNQLAAPPRTFGHEALVPQWGMLGNDVAGDCVFAGAGHETMLWCAESGVPVSISDKTALANYSRVTGFDPKQTDAQGNNPTDQGTDVADWLAIRRKTGFLDDSGRAHKIGAYLALEPGNIDQLRYAAYYFDGVGLGINFPEQWMDTFQRGQRYWGALKKPNYVGGHYLTAVAWRSGEPVIITWGAKVQLSPAAYEQVCDEAYAYLSPERLKGGHDLQGFDLSKLTDMLSQLKGVK